jgi:hypothetical protein
VVCTAHQAVDHAHASSRSLSISRASR